METNTEKVDTENQQIPADSSKPVIGTPEFARLGGEAREGTKNKKTLAKEEAWKTYEQTMIDALWKVTKSQLLIACGSHMIFRIDTILDDKGKKIRKKPVRVTEEWEIEHFIDMYCNGELNNEADEQYYFATAIDPDGSAISDILDRLNGKPRQSTDITSGGKALVMNFDPRLEKID